MAEVWKKLNLKDHSSILVVDPPESFEAQLATLDEVTVLRDWTAAKSVNFVLAFVTRLSEVRRHAAAIDKMTEGDAVVWLAYPKQSSKKYTCQFNRDNGWDAVEAVGFQGVRQVAIDEDWSALRFRRSEFVKSRR